MIFLFVITFSFFLSRIILHLSSQSWPSNIKGELLSLGMTIISLAFIDNLFNNRSWPWFKGYIEEILGKIMQYSLAGCMLVRQCLSSSF